VSKDILPPPELPPDAHKGTAGRLLCFAGSEHMPGAAILTVRAAHRAGAGLVTLATLTRQLLHVVPVASPETTYLDLCDEPELLAGRLPRRVRDHAHHARVAGPGLSRSAAALQLARQLVADEFDGPLVLDADALHAFDGELELIRRRAGALVLTPHPGEAAALLGDDVPAEPEGRIEAARHVADVAGGICVLKGLGTVVTDGERVFVNRTGNAGMATAGSGDVLSGILGAYLCRLASSAQVEGGRGRFDAFSASVAAVHVHGLAGDLAARAIGRRGLIASDLIDHLPAAQLAFESEAGASE